MNGDLANDTFAGFLTKENKSLSFTYDTLFVEDKATLPLSASLPQKKRIL